MNQKIKIKEFYKQIFKINIDLNQWSYIDFFYIKQIH